ncbi:MAG: efflux RND transporter periplasmic adaptor subunit, partial [Hydrogenophaga sp.]
TPFRFPSSSSVQRPVAWAAALLAGAVLLGTAATAQTGAQPAAARAAASIEVPVVTLGSRAVGTGLELDGSLQAVRQSTLSAQASGRIAELRVKAGDAVKAGQVLAVVDDRATQAGMAQAQAGFAQADAQMANARAHFERTRDLRAQGFVAQAALDTAQAQLRAAEAGVAAARAGQTQSALAQGFTRLTAPYDGFVLQTHVEAGSLALPGSPVVTVYAPQLLRAVVHVPASMQAVAQVASRVEVELPGAPARWVKPAQVNRLPVTDAVSQTVEWRLDLNEADSGGQVPGRSVRVRFLGDAPAGSAQRLMVPSAALLQRGELTGVFIATENGFVLRAVRTGARHGDAGVEVLSGLRAGDRVALDPVKAGLVGARPATQ